MPRTPTLNDLTVKDFTDGARWAKPTSMYQLWFEYLWMSPSYELARRYQTKTLKAKYEHQIPTDFDRVLEVYRDLGDVRLKSYAVWWRARGVGNFGREGKRPVVRNITNLLRTTDPAGNLTSNAERYVKTLWRDEGRQRSMVLAVPMGLPKRDIVRAVKGLLDKQADNHKTLLVGPTKYPLAGKRHSKKALLLYQKVIWFQAARPKDVLWRVGARAAVSKTYSGRLDADAKSLSGQNEQDREALTILTSRAFNRGNLIAENAARGIFPSHAPLATAIKIDPNRLRSVLREKVAWEKAALAEKVLASNSK